MPLPRFCWLANQHRFIFRLAILCFLIFCSSLSLPANDAPEISLTSVITAWEERESAIKSASFHCTTEVLATGPRDADHAHNAPAAPATVEDDSVRIAFSGGRIHYSHRTPAGALGGHQASQYRSIFDRDASSDLTIPSQVSDTEYPIQLVRGDGYTDRSNVNLKPVFLCYRPFDSSFLAISRETLYLSPDRPIIGDKQALVVRADAGNADFSTEYWVDPERNFLVMRYQEISRRNLVCQIDISYAHDAGHGWIPNRWEWSFLTPIGDVSAHARITVDDYSINTELSNELFEIQSPPGTWIFDQRSNEIWVIRPDGSRRAVSVAEREQHLSYSDLIRSETDSAVVGATGANGRRNWLFILNVVAVIVAASFFVFRRVRAARASPHRKGGF